MSKPILLGVNIDHVATLRQARGTSYPDVLAAARAAVDGGADGITVHLREDRRHIQDQDVEYLHQQHPAAINLEMAATDEMLNIARRLRPEECCLVPERRQELTTEGGLNAAAQIDYLTEHCQGLTEAGIKVSLFIDPEPEQIEASSRIGAPVVELHTGQYAVTTDSDSRVKELSRLQKATELGALAGLQVNAGHGLHYGNVQAVAAIPEIVYLNIGHSIVARAMFTGLENAVREMKRLMTQSRDS